MVSLHVSFFEAIVTKEFPPKSHHTNHALTKSVGLPHRDLTKAELEMGSYEIAERLAARDVRFFLAVAP